MKGEFYKMDFRAWNTGTVDLSLEQEAAYLRLCHAMYDAGGPVPGSTRFLMSIFRCANSKAAGLVRQLVKAGKIQRTPDGLLTNRRVTTELSNRERLSETRRAAGEMGGKSHRIAGGGKQSEPRVTSECGSSDPGVTPECGSSDHPVAPSKSLKNNDAAKANASTLRSRGEERREEPPKAPKGADPEGFAEFWKAYPKRDGDNSRKTALRAYGKVIGSGITPAAILSAVRAHAADMRAKGKLGTELVPMASTWLNQGRFERFTNAPEAHREAARADPAARLARVPEDEWRARVRSWESRCGHWPWQGLTEPPDDPRTKVPAHVLAEFGIDHGGSGRPSLRLVAAA
ncbi:YdaU family protein [Methylobacterium sp. J-059]|uniref:DUF1376 domain-containing protein n=1 Tax=Methylobacterium sp. J-059 TaxID=2836643 RepID=UPI001FBB7453|nr:DUF1376 domain-containing protein [Methylobacterium sp. J-059]MCJ2038250.1 YdaU family protein [Methylobacterium sp. J-059]